MNDYASFAPQPAEVAVNFDAPVASQYPEPTTDVPQPEVAPQPPLAGTPEQVPQIYAYVKEITPAGSYDESSSKLEFDVILNVSCNGSNNTIVKKIAFCKYSLAQEFSKLQPVTVVEEKKPAALSEEAANRLRALCNY